VQAVPDALAPELGALLASDPEAMRDPHPLFGELREAGPVLSFGPMVLITRHADVRDACRDAERLSNRTFLGSRAEDALSRMTAEQRDAYRVVSEFESRYVSRSDGEDHARRRRLMQRAFTPRRINALRARIEAIAAGLLDDLAAERGGSGAPDREAELISFAWRLPLMVVAELLEIPAEDLDAIHGWSAAIGRNRRGVDPVALLGALDAITAMKEYIGDRLPGLTATDGESALLAELLEAHAGDRLSVEELTAMFVILLFAGHETTTGLIAGGVVELLRHPDQWRWLAADPGGRAPAAVEELLRFVSPVQWTWRLAASDYRCGDSAIAAGTTVALMLAGANRDPSVFAGPGELDLGREDAGRHLAFGLGPHFCIGNALARLEAEVAFRVLAERFPRMSLACDPSQLRWQGNAMLRQLASLRVTF
jgi:cytochrome P450